MTSEQRSYQNAKQRCINPRATGYKNYGGRGIEFRFNSFEEFYAELGPRPKGLTLDRKDNDGHYEKGNVRWITRHKSLQNRRVTEARRTAMHFNGLKQPHEIRVRNGHLWSIKQPREAKVRGGYNSTHQRWHVLRGIVNSNCNLCAVKEIV